MLLVGVLDKVGTFGMIRFCLPLFPERLEVGRRRWSSSLAVISILYGALLAIGQTDIMRLIAYTSVSHFGFIVLGIFALTTTGGAGSTLYMVNHGFSTAALFLIGGDARRAAGQQADPRLRWLAAGHARCSPASFLVAGLSGLALPGLSHASSPSSWCWSGTFQRYPVAGGHRDRRASSWRRSTSC